MIYYPLSVLMLSDRNHRQLFIPAGFAHGFCVLSESAHVIYKCSDYYRPGDEGRILWSDPAIKIDWPVQDPLVSEKDRALQELKHCRPMDLPQPM
jgi:dTDP-4-dehydrorhamnose 3,5-epimerase